MAQKKDRKFQTHIPEPRWQQVVSIAAVLILVAGYIWLTAASK